MKTCYLKFYTKLIYSVLTKSAAPFISALILFVSAPAVAKDYLVKSQAQYQKVVAKLVPGDKVILANGVWQDFEILFEAKGNKEKPIELTAQTKGKTIISGQSNLRLAGEYLIVSGLVFKNGHTPTSSVIDFRKNKTTLANHSRVTELVIDNFSNPERFENDYWVAMYGKHNRFDHNHLEGKRNKGVTMAVRLNTQDSRENYHRIDHNYFGPRPILGANGGETLRIGTSHFSLSDSFTTVESNYFDRCDGELEIISNKSGNNKIIGNVFFESRGTLTMRHGNDNTVSENVFFGNGVDHTGGIRLINKRQTITNNYIEGLAGYRFGGALVVMNGVPNSPINRYHQVEDSFIENNTLVNSDHIQLAAGSDTERSAVPVRTTFKNNIIFNQNKKDTFTVYDDVSGISFENNLLNEVEKPTLDDGFISKALSMKRADNGLMYALDGDSSVGVSQNLKPITKDQVGVSWYPKPGPKKVFDKGQTIKVKAGIDTLSKAVASAKDGDILVLSAGDYSVSRTMVLDKAVTVKAASIAKPLNVTITYERGALFEIQYGGSLKLQGLKISGAESPDSSNNRVIRTVRRSMLSNYNLIVDNVEVVDLDVNHSFTFLSVGKGTFADNIEITNSYFKNITGYILALAEESDDDGIYNAEYVTIKNSTFENVQGAVLNFYRGGRDESTFGPHLEMSGNSLSNVGNGNRNKAKAAIRLQGVQVTSIKDNDFANTPAINIIHTVGEPRTRIEKNRFIATPVPTVVELNSDEENTAIIVDNVVKTK